MQYNSQLYQEFVQRKAKTNSDLYAQTYKRRAILQKFMELSDSTFVSLETSIPLLRNLGVITEISSVQQIVYLMEQKKNDSEGWDAAQRQLWECRLIYFLWEVIAREHIDMREFKELLLVLINNQGNRYEAIQESFGDKEEISELLETWDRIFLIVGLGTASHQEITDISIIKSKNEGKFGDNKENIHENHDIGFTTDRYSCTSNRQKYHSRSRSKLEKSFSKKTAKTAIDRSNSVERVTTKRSQPNSLANYVSHDIHSVNYFRDSDNLSLLDEKRLVDRLYDCNVYKKREEQKRRLQQEKIKVQLQQCTFKPSITRSSNGRSRATIDRNIKGYQKAVNRMKSGYLKKQELKQNLELRMWKQGPIYNGKPTIGYAPRFHHKPPKQQKSQLFQLKFTLGRLTIPVKIRESDKIEQLVAHLGRIYSLKQYEKGYIHDSIIQALEEYSQLYGQACQSVLG